MVEGRTVELTRIEKPLWQAMVDAPAITKGELIRYYADVAPHLLPHVRGRFLAFARYPEGIDGPRWFDHRFPHYDPPPWVRRVPYQAADHRTEFVVCDDAATLAWLANQACIELHPWLSTVERPDRPDRLLIDLDPVPPAGFADACRVASICREPLAAAGLPALPKTSGSGGLHLVASLPPGDHSFDSTRRAAHTLGRHLQARQPGLVTVAPRPADRAGRVYLDYRQNHLGKSAAAPYSVRALPGAPVSTPLRWEEVAAGARGEWQPRDLNLRTVPGRLRADGDPWSSAGGR